jgi:hypothetical protein
MAMGKAGTRVVFQGTLLRVRVPSLGRSYWTNRRSKNFLGYAVLIGKALQTCMRQHQAKSDSGSGWMLPHLP